MIELKIRRNRIGPIRGRHPWVFSGALLKVPEGLDSGMPVKLLDESSKFLAQGYFNSYSQIAVRLWSWEEQEEIDSKFFEKRIRAAYELRENFVADKNTNSYRLVNGENDLLPGLIVDKYADYLSVQFHTKGMEFWKTQVVDALEKIINPQGIYERSDVGHRLKEEERGGSGLLAGEIPERIKILENGLKFYVDVRSGQKTGFFLDQRDKRLALKKYVKGKNVLNCFSYTGGFSVYALDGGAEKVTSVDVSEAALELAEENAKLNSFKNHEVLRADVKAYLTTMEMEKKKFEVIILDPPAFIKDRHKIREGLQGYKKINELAMKILPPGGILVSASCSAHLSLPDFRYMISEAAGRAGRTVQILETYTHGIDHPELVAFTEGEYLKCVFVVVS